MLGPIALVILFSFGSNALIGFPMGGLTLDWYGKLLADTGFHAAFWTSLIVALATAILATVTGTLAAIGLMKRGARRRPRRAGSYCRCRCCCRHSSSPSPSSSCSCAASASALGLPVVVLGHILVAQPFVILIVMARLARFDQATVDAARDLGATRFRLSGSSPCRRSRARSSVPPWSAPPSPSMISSSPPSPSAAAIRSRPSSGARCAPRLIPRSMRSRRFFWF